MDDEYTWMFQNTNNMDSFDVLSFNNEECNSITKGVNLTNTDKATINFESQLFKKDSIQRQDKQSASKMSGREKKKLLKEFRRVGTQWKVIARKFNNRSNDFLKNNFFGLLRLSFRRLLRHFGIEKTTKMLSLIKPSTMTEFAKMKIKDKQSGKTIEAVDIIEDFAFLEDSSHMDRLGGYLELTRGFATQILKFLRKFHKVNDHKINAFIEGRVQKNSFSGLIDMKRTVNETFQREIEVNCQNTPKTIVDEESKVVSLKEEIKETRRTFELDRDSNREIDLSETFINIVSNFRSMKRQIVKSNSDLSTEELIKINSFIGQFFISVKNQRNSQFSFHKDNQGAG